MARGSVGLRPDGLARAAMAAPMRTPHPTGRLRSAGGSPHISLDRSRSKAWRIARLVAEQANRTQRDRSTSQCLDLSDLIPIPFPVRLLERDVIADDEVRTRAHHVGLGVTSA